MIKKIMTSDVPSLREKSKKIVKLDKKTRVLIKDMKDTLGAQKDPVGVGLAAAQVGKNVRMFIMRKDSGKLMAIINPEIVSRSKKSSESKKGEILEGCLSIPLLYGPLKRSNRITIKHMDEEGKMKKQEFKGLEAQIVLHEIDHLNGILFVDRILKEKRPLYKQNKHGEWDEVDF